MTYTINTANIDTCDMNTHRRSGTLNISPTFLTAPAKPPDLISSLPVISLCTWEEQNKIECYYHQTYGRTLRLRYFSETLTISGHRRRGPEGEMSYGWLVALSRIRPMSVGRSIPRASRSRQSAHRGGPLAPMPTGVVVL